MDNWFAEEEARSNGRLKFIPCPHSAEVGHPYGDAALVTLLDNPQTGVTVLVLCPFCQNIVIGRFVDDIIQRTVDRAFNALFPKPIMTSLSPYSIENGYDVTDPRPTQET